MFIRWKVTVFAALISGIAGGNIVWAQPAIFNQPLGQAKVAIPEASERQQVRQRAAKLLSLSQAE